MAFAQLAETDGLSGSVAVALSARRRREATPGAAAPPPKLEAPREISEYVDESRLLAELTALKELSATLRDWRQLEPEFIAARFRAAVEDGPERRPLLAKAIFAGTAQACLRGRFWAPHFSCPGAQEVDTRHLTSPISRMYPLGKSPPAESAARPSGRPGQLTIDCVANCNPLDASSRLHLGSPEHRHVAVVRYTRCKDPRNEVIRYGHCREDQLFLRTTYFRSFERMETEIHAPVADSIDAGGLIYTPGVAVLRGPIEEGALWFREPPRVDIIWVGLTPRPQLEEQSQYGNDKDKTDMIRTVDRIFAWAAYHGVDTLVLPPLGCGDRGCAHPELDVADILHKAAYRYAGRVPHVVLASDYPGHFGHDERGGWWTAFEDAVKHGRPPTLRPVCVPVPPFPRLKKSPLALLEKNAKLGRGPVKTPRRFNQRFI